MGKRPWAGTDWRGRLLEGLFVDEFGRALFLGTLVLFWSTWQVGFFVNDSMTLVNTLGAMMEGRLYLLDPQFGPPIGKTPGTVYVNGRVYGQSYGYLALAVPVALLVRGLATISATGVALTGGFSLLVLTFALSLGRLVDRKQVGGWVGSGVALFLFVLGTPAVRPYGPALELLVALQLTTMLVAAGTVIGVYRLVRVSAGPRVGTVAGIAVAVASPVWFWAPIPKRHSVVAFLTVLTALLLWWSRAGTTGRDRRVAHGGAYATAGLCGWVIAPQTLLLVLALAVADLLTLPRSAVTARRALTVGGLFLLSLAPIIVTNTLISGDPATPPRWLDAYHTADVNLLGPEAASDQTAGTRGAAPTAGAGSPEPGAAGSRQPVGTLGQVPVLGGIIAGLERFWWLLSNGAARIDIQKLGEVFVRRGYNPEATTKGGYVTTQLTPLESMPVLAVLGIAPAYLGRRIRSLLTDRRGDPLVAVDLFVVVYGVLLTLLYLRDLPVHASVTTRYLHPLYPLGVYGVCRLRPIQAVVTERPRVLAASYLVTVVGGTIALVIGLLWATPTVGTAVQVHALVALGTAALVLAWGSSATFGAPAPTVGGVVLGVAGAATTVFMLAAQLQYFVYAHRWAVPVVGRLGTAVSLI